MYQSMWYAPGMGNKPVAGIGNDTSTTPAPSVSDAPVGAELSGMVTPSSAGSTPESHPD